jgi:BlaI family penicillinase repressor
MAPSHDVTDAEQAVLEVLWQSEHGATVREVVLSIYGKHEHSLHGGVKSFLDRLMKKGLVEVDKSGFAHRFRALISRRQFVGQQLQQLANDHFDGALAPMLLSLVETTPLSKEDRSAIEQIIEGLDGKGGRS